MEDDDIQSEEQEPQYEMTAEEATSLEAGPTGTAGRFNRKNVLITICISLAAIVMLGVIINTAKSSKKSKSSGVDEYAQNRSNSEFLSQLQNSALRDASRRDRDSEIDILPVAEENFLNEPALPPVSFERQPQQDPRLPPPNNFQNQPQQLQYAGGGSQSQPPPNDSHFRSSLVPQIQGSLFNGQSRNTSQQQAQNNGANNYDDYLNSLNSRAASYANPPQGGASQGNSNQNSNQEFYGSTNSSGVIYNGQFLGDNALWMGTIIPGILETAINTDLPGQILARVTQNVYDSQTGRYLLIPQGTVLIARYNSSVSYAQSRVQIIWDTLIRPDGFLIDLEGANGVDRAGMSGQEAKYNENWFEYVKASGIITLFSYANAKLTETVNKYSSKDDNGNSAPAQNIAQANAQFFNQLSSELVSRAMQISPTLTVDNGTLINIMLNKNLYLPPVNGYPASSKYIRN